MKNKLIPALDLKDTIFPKCVIPCSTLKEMGLSSCESFCPWKFLDGEPKKEFPIPVDLSTAF